VDNFLLIYDYSSLKDQVYRSLGQAVVLQLAHREHLHGLNAAEHRLHHLAGLGAVGRHQMQGLLRRKLHEIRLQHVVVSRSRLVDP